MTQTIAKYIAPAVFFGALIVGPTLHAEENNADDAGTDFPFAFNQGTSMDQVGSKEIDVGFNGRFGRNGGVYTAIESEMSLQYQATRDLQLELEAAGAFHHVKNVPDMDDRNAGTFGGLAIGLTYRLLDRTMHGIGLAVSAAPYWTRVDDDTGKPVNGFGTEFRVAGDIELVPRRLMAVVNVSYDPESSKSRIDGSWSRQSTLGLTGGLMAKLTDNLSAGLEARYLRRYDAINLGAFAGQALYVGPTMSIALSDNKFLTLGWSAQVAGRANGEDGALDLTNFDRQQARLVFGMSF